MPPISWRSSPGRSASAGFAPWPARPPAPPHRETGQLFRLWPQPCPGQRPGSAGAPPEFQGGFKHVASLLQACCKPPPLSSGLLSMPAIRILRQGSWSRAKSCRAGLKDTKRAPKVTRTRPISVPRNANKCPPSNPARRTSLAAVKNRRDPGPARSRVPPTLSRRERRFNSAHGSASHGLARHRDWVLAIRIRHGRRVGIPRVIVQPGR